MGDELSDEDKIYTRYGIFKLSEVNLEILNSDGLAPKLASDLGTYIIMTPIPALSSLCSFLLTNYISECFNNGFFEVKKSPIAGYGAFAVKDIEANTPILLERELFHAHANTLVETIEALTDEQKKAYHTLHGYKRSPDQDMDAAIWETNR